MKKALRALAARPAFTAVSIATLALGFGVNAAIFSLTRTVLLRPLPYPDADRLVAIGEADPSRGMSSAIGVPATYAEWRGRVASFQSTAAWRFVYFTLAGQVDPPLRVQGVIAEPSFFSLFGVEPALGRLFTAENTVRGADDVVVLSNGFWHRQFGGDPAVVGRSIIVDGTPCTIVGVLPDSFKFFRVLNRELDVWRPLVLNRSDVERTINLYARLTSGTSVESATAVLATTYSAFPRAPFRDGWQPTVTLLTTRWTASQRPILLALEAAVAFVMCIAAANIASLVLAVAAGRRKDLAVRSALGASRRHIAIELARETLILAGAGAAAGLLLALWIVAVLNQSVSYADINRIEPFRVDAWVVGLTMALAIVAAAIFALLPARHATDRDVIDALKDASLASTPGASSRRMRAGLVVAEVALSIGLLTSALELTRHAFRLNAMDRGVDTARVMTAQLSLNGSKYDDTHRLTQFATVLVDRIASAPDVEAASLVNYPPLSSIATSYPVVVDRHLTTPGREPRGLCWIVAPRYFATVGIPILAGRDFSPADNETSAGVVIVSRGFAQRFWASDDPIGRTLMPLFPESDAFWIPRAVRRPLTVIGVVANVREDGIGPGDSDPQLYLPYSQNPTRIMTVLVKSRAAGAAAAIRAAVRAADPDQPTYDEKTLDAVRAETFTRSREIAWLIGAFAILAVGLSAIGVYGLISFAVTARRREIGIRIALGAARSSVMWLVVREVSALALLGVAVAVPLCAALGRAVQSRIVGAPATETGAILAAAAALTIVALAAALVPARRAARFDPCAALKTE